jgi:hypothetical protein
MPNYKETAVTGTSWIRAYQMRLTNPYNALPKVTFDEEKIVSYGSNVVKTPIIAKTIDEVSVDFSDPTVKFDLVNPDTDAVIGSATYQDFHVMVYSLYHSLGIVRDARVAAITGL